MTPARNASSRVLTRSRPIAAGHDPTDEPFLERRDDRKIKKAQTKPH
jgi:membrane protein